MLDIKFIREKPHLVQENNKNRGVEVDIKQLLQFDQEKRKIQVQLQELQAQRNLQSKTKPSDTEIQAMKKISEQIKELEHSLAVVSDELMELMIKTPNLTHPDVKVSDNEDDNVVIEKIGQPAKFKFKPKDHLELGLNLDLIDMERGAKVAGAKFYYLKNELALMEQALVQYALDIITKMGYLPMTTPDLAKTDIIARLGYSPRGESSQIYEVKDTDLSLIGTAEITLGAYHADELLDITELPKRYVSVSHCFRTEAGAYSKYAKGIFRVHQFTKVEMFVYARPEESEQIQAEILAIEKEIFRGLGIPFRVIDHCTADLGNPSSRTFDLEAWLPAKPNKDGGEGDWAEITSCSNCTDYQARGLNIKYKDGDQKKLVHTLNGTGVAVPRALIAIIENYQQADGSLEVPKALRPYLNNLKVIKR